MKNILILILSLFSLTSYSQTFYGYEVCDFNQGLTNTGTSISTSRSNTGKALGIPQNVDVETGTINFFSLGFGGNITLKLQTTIEVLPTTTLSIYETTYGYNNCNTYGERAEVYVSKNNLNYFLLGETCLNNNTIFDVYQSGLDSIQYVKIVDVSNIASFSNFSFVSDGYDLDGIEIFNNGPLPIELKYFGVDFNQPYLNIKVITASEANTDKLIIESSTDASNFNYLTEFKAAGFSSFERVYDKKLIFEPKSQITYFRLVEVDFDGEQFYFDIIVSNTRNSDKVEMYYFDLLGRRVNSNDAIFKLKK